MDWDYLRVFLAVARHGQLLAAGRHLHLNHATIARRLDALEASLKTTLFDRGKGGCLITESGEQLLPVAERIETELLSISERFITHEAQASGTVRLGAPDGLGNYYLANRLGILSVRHPNLIIELVPLPRAFSLSRREADVAIVLDRPTQGRLLVSKLVDYTLSVYASAEYLGRNGTPQSLNELAEHSVVTGVEDLAYASALDYSAEIEASARRKFRCASVMGQIEAVRSGCGIGILHDFVARDIAGLVPILPSHVITRSYHLVSHPDTSALRRIALLREFLAARFRDERHHFRPLSR